MQDPVSLTMGLSVVAWISKKIKYGLYLSDHSILDAIETEIVILTGIILQNLPREARWHLRGLGRVGVGMEDVEIVQKRVNGLFIRSLPVLPGRDSELRRQGRGARMALG